MNKHSIPDVIMLWLAANHFAFCGNLHHLGSNGEASVRDYDTAAEFERVDDAPLGAVAAPPPS